ncbi:MAG: glycosyltransferase [Flavobacteriales bacterium]|nr:glycosyltransferase [Flavobacteriales bacterium]
MKKSLRIVQLIDSLHPGGAERMALNLANGLSSEIEFSGLMVTREEGGLRQLVEDKTPYIFLNRNSVLDFKALKKGVVWLKENQVDIIHAHGTSLFFAVLCKLRFSKIKIIWHDHYGNSELLQQRPKILLFFLIRFVHQVIVVNQHLLQWNKSVLYVRKIQMIPNFSNLISPNSSKNFNMPLLNGKEGKRILCVANFRKQKNHELILKVAEKMLQHFPDWTFHLVGKSFEDDYMIHLKNFVESREIANVFFYHDAFNISDIMKQVNISILSSISEGLPLVVLEYANNELPILATDVGDVSLVVKDQVNGFLVKSNDEIGFYEKLVQLIENEELRAHFGKTIKEHVEKEFSEIGFYERYFSFLEV